MKIALLNLPLDNNYGGNLQRYALLKVLQDMGHEVTHIYLKVRRHLPWYKWAYSYPKRFVQRYMLGNNNTFVFEEKRFNEERNKGLALTLQFYDKYIHHTSECFTIKEIKQLCRDKYDAYLVGSDQVWRKGSTGQIGLKNYFLHFAAKENVRKYAYAVSLGVDNDLLSEKEHSDLGKLYSRFDAVSVREKSAIALFDQFGWVSPEAELCLDPTLLLESSDYIKLITEDNAVNLTEGKIYRYILDPTEKVKFVTEYYSKKLSEEYISVGLGDTAKVSISQWLNNIRMADFVITDSYHGVVFSVIFRRPFIFLGNKGRGNTRVQSLFEVLNLGDISEEVSDFSEVSQYLEDMKERSMAFLKRITM